MATKHFYKVSIVHTSTINVDGVILNEKPLDREVFVTQEQFDEVKKVLDTVKQ